jgi:hypothetical protein
MTQRDRDRLVVLKKAQKKLITQSQAAKELDVSERHVRRLLVRLREGGDRSVIHGLRGRESNRKLSAETREKAIRILSGEVYWGVRPDAGARVSGKEAQAGDRAGKPAAADEASGLVAQPQTADRSNTRMAPATQFTWRDGADH